MVRNTPSRVDSTGLPLRHSRPLRSTSDLLTALEDWDKLQLEMHLDYQQVPPATRLSQGQTSTPSGAPSATSPGRQPLPQVDNTSQPRMLRLLWSCSEHFVNILRICDRAIEVLLEMSWVMFPPAN